MRARILCAWFGLTVGLAPLAMAQTEPPAAPPGAADLAKQLANPVASLISVPLQSNWDFNVGPGEDTRFLLNFQPVMPFRLSEKMNLITRVIVPTLGQPALFEGGQPASGLSDILASAFFSPAEPGFAIWGAGPVVLLPTTSEPTLGTQKWAAGPTIVILKQTGPLTYGALANHLWSFAGDEDRTDLNQTYVQPFFAVTSAGGMTVTLSSETTANWKAASGEEWTIPVFLQLSKVTRLGKRPLSVGAGGGYYVETPAGQPDWRLRMTFALMFPTM